MLLLFFVPSGTILTGSFLNRENHPRDPRDPQSRIKSAADYSSIVQYMKYLNPRGVLKKPLTLESSM